MEVAKVPSFLGEEMRAFRAEVLICDAAASLDKRRRAGALVLRLDGQPKMLLMQRASSVLGFEENGATGGVARGVKRFFELLDVGHLAGAGDIEVKEIQEFLRIRRLVHSLAAFITRFHLAFDK